MFICLYIFKGVQGLESVLDARNYVFHYDVGGYGTDSMFPMVSLMSV